MSKPTYVCDYELTASFDDRRDLHRFSDALVLLRLHGRPIGQSRVPIVAGRVDRETLGRRIVRDYSAKFATLLAERVLQTRTQPTQLSVGDLFRPSPSSEFASPSVTVAVCTRDRTPDLERCLTALAAIEYSPLDIIVVDNAPTTDATEQLLRTQFPNVRYVREERPGLDWARNRAILECRGEIIAFTDDDVVVDAGWVAALARVFAEDGEVMAVTGLVLPYELETDTQRLFEEYGGFGRGFIRRWYRAPVRGPVALVHGGTGKFGTGANMAFRRQVFASIGGFDPALDVGTVTNGGGDLEMFFRVLKAGHTLVYEPAALVRHRHRRSYTELRTQIANNGIGFYAYLRRTASTFPAERLAVTRLGLWWLWWWNIRRLLVRGQNVPRDLVVAELVGSIRGLTRYPRALARRRDIAKAHSHEASLLADGAGGPAPRKRQRAREAVRRVDVSRPLRPLDDLTAFERVRVLVIWGEAVIGTVTIEHQGAVISPAWLADTIAQQLAIELLAVGTGIGKDVAWMRLVTAAAETLTTGVNQTAESAIDTDLSVSVVVATRDRPGELQRCLESLVRQRTARRFEVVVVDNNPDSGLTAPVASRYPGVVLVNERRPGLSYARNRGIAAASGDIIATTDDDVTCPPDWIERLIQPFQRDDVMVVTGNVLPGDLENEAQQTFEAYGGLGRGWQRRVVDGEWFAQFRRSVPTWRLGCTANAAFRAAIFADPAIGLFDEALGAGTPSGCSEDTYLFYRVLKAGHAIAYEPNALVWHYHRSTMAALRRQIFSYAKGHVAYQLTTWLRDHDRRGLVRIGLELPGVYRRRAWARLRGRSSYPLTFIGLEILGTLAGPLALWRARRRTRRLGRSSPPATAKTYAVRLESPRP